MVRESVFDDRDGEVLSFQSLPNRKGVAVARDSGASRHRYVLDVESDELSQVLEGLMPMLGGLLQEKTPAVRAQKLEEMVDFMTGRMIGPTATDVEMAKRLSARRARMLKEFGYATAEQLADMNHSRAESRTALADNWKKRHQVFSVRHRDGQGKPREVFPLFQFEEGRPIRAVQGVIEAFGEHKAPWKLAMWFVSNNGWLPGTARPVDLLESNPGAVVEAARRDAAGSGV